MWGHAGVLSKYSTISGYQWQFSEMEKVVNFYDEEDMSMSSLFLSGSQVNMKQL